MVKSIHCLANTGALFVVLFLAATPTAFSQAPVHVINGFECFVDIGHATAYEDLWERLPERLEAVRLLLGDDVLTGGEIHIVADINRWFQDRGENQSAPDWAQGLAIPSRQLILLEVPDPNLLTTLTHELSHLAVHQAAGDHHVPRWFLEGFAMIQAEDWDLERISNLAQAALFSNTLSFSSLDRSFPEHHQTASLAYTQSFHFVRRLISEHGAAPIQQWLAGVSEGTEWRESFQQAFGHYPEVEFENWRDSVKVWYAWIPAVVSATTLWTGMAFLAVLGYRRVKRRRRLLLAQRRAEEDELYPPDPDDELFV